MLPKRLQFFTKKVVYKENCGTVTEHNQNIRLVSEVQQI